MGLYNVVKPCVVGKLHYVRPTAQPIQVDYEVAAPLVESDCLEPYPSSGARLDSEVGRAVRQAAAEVKPTAEDHEPRPRGRRGNAED